MKRPNLFIVGAPKCGTTSLCAYLERHPDVFMCRPKEPFYFGHDFSKPLRPSLETYESYFQFVENQRIVAEGSTWYLASKTAAEEIKHYSPDAKIVVMLRRPADLLESLFNFRVFTGREDLGSLDEAFALESERLAGRKLPPGTDMPKEQYAYSEVIKFGEQIARFTEQFGRENLHLILYDDFKRDTRAEFEKVLQFIGLQPLENFKKFEKHNRGRKNKSRFFKKFLNRPPAFLSKIGRLVFPSREKRRAIYQWFVRLNSSDLKQKEFKISAELARKLAPLVASEVAEIEMLTGRDLSHWKI